MSSIEIPRDDLRVLDLKLDNASSESVKPAKPVQPYPGIADRNRIQQTTREKGSQKEQRRKKERRKRDRRNHNEPVLLDTRVNRDRRQEDRRQSDNTSKRTQKKAQPRRKGVDIYA